MMRRLLFAMIVGAWIAVIAALVLPPIFALFGGGIGSAALTPLFYGLWAIVAVWLFALRSATRMSRASLIAGGALTLLVTVLSFWPPVDPTTLMIGVGALPLAGGQWWIAARFRHRGGNFSGSGS